MKKFNNQITKIRYSLFFSLLFISSIIYAQTSHCTIKGNVINDNDTPIEIGNVMVLAFADSSLIKGDIFYDGEFELTNISATHFWLAFTAVGYTTNYIEVERASDKDFIDAGTISMHTMSLDEVVVSAQRLPSFRQEMGKVVVDVENNVFSQSSSVLDILSKSPRLIVKDNNISVFGKGTAIILINGRKVLSKDVLSSISGSEVSKIEIISNPSAKYDADGKSVVNIIMKDVKIEGINAKVIANYTQREYESYRLGGSVSYKKGNWDAFASYDHSPYTNVKNDNYIRTFSSLEDPIKTEQSIRKVTRFNRAHRPKAALNYTTQKHRIGVEYDGSYWGAPILTASSNTILQDGTSPMRLFTNKSAHYTYDRNSFNINYTYTPDTTGKELLVSLDHTYAQSTFSEDIFETGDIVNEQIKRSSNNSSIPIKIAQIDYSTPLLNTGVNVEMGVKYIDASTRDNILLEIKEAEGVFVPDVNASQKYNYTEDIAAAYVSLSKKIDKLSLEIALRAENTTAQGASSSYEIVDTSYTNLFPTAGISYELSKNLEVGASFSTRIKRPTFQNLDPFVTYLDSFSVIQGNPLLVPEITQSFETNLTYMKYASINFGISNTSNAMFPVIKQLENSAISALQFENVESFRKVFASINLPYQSKKWTTFNSFGYEQKDIKYQTAEELVHRSRGSWYLYLYNKVTLPLDINVEATFTYHSSGIEGLLEYNPGYNVALGVSRSFLDNTLDISLYANDIFKTDRYNGTGMLPNITVDYRAYYDNAYLRLSAVYKIGKLKKFKSQSTRTQSTSRIQVL